MKKTITTLLTLTMAASLAGCGSKPADEPTKSPETVIESAVDFYTEVWDALGVAFRAKCKIFSRHLQKPILKTEKGRFKGL